jgi:predicted nucleic acid-binding protein
MKRIKIYLETSAISNLDQPNMQNEMADMHVLWDLIKQGEFDVVISSTVIDELIAIKDTVKRDNLLDYLAEIKYEPVFISDEIRTIANQIILNGILSAKCYEDCEHLACAITSNCDCIVSYNFKHLVNFRTIHGARAISNLHGYGNIDIMPASILIQKGE